MIDAILDAFRIQNSRVRKHFKQLFKFALVGGSAAMIDLGVLTISVESFKINENIAVIFSSVPAMIYVFLINKYVTFQNRQREYAKQASKFALVYGVAFGLNAVVSRFFLWLGFFYLLAKILAIALIAVWNYYFSHTFVFKHDETL